MFLSSQVTKKLAGKAAGTAAWVTNVGNERGQVLMSILNTLPYQHTGTKPYLPAACRHRDRKSVV